MPHNPESYRKGIQMMEQIVRVRGRPGTWWVRALQGGDRIMVIPIKDGVPVVHKFLVISREEIIRDQEEVGRTS